MKHAFLHKTKTNLIAEVSVTNLTYSIYFNYILSTVQNQYPCNSSSMSVITKELARTQFAERLNAALDRAEFPRPNGKRTTALTREMVRREHDVTPMAVRKWLMGESAPSFDKLLDVSEISNTSIDFLVSGKGPARVDSYARQLINLLPDLTVEQKKTLLQVAYTFTGQKKS